VLPTAHGGTSTAAPEDHEPHIKSMSAANVGTLSASRTKIGEKLFESGWRWLRSMRREVIKASAFTSTAERSSHPGLMAPATELAMSVFGRPMPNVPPSFMEARIDLSSIKAVAGGIAYVTRIEEPRLILNEIKNNVTLAICLSGLHA